MTDEELEKEQRRVDEVRKERRLIVDASLFQDAAFVIGELLQLISENEKSRIVLEYDPGTKKMVVTKDTTRNEEDDPSRYVVIERDEYEMLIDLWKKQVRDRHPSHRSSL